MNEPTKQPLAAALVEPGTRDLLAAIREALTVPYPADFADNDKALHILMARAAGIRGVLNAILDGRAHPEHGVTAVRDSAADYPIRYVPVTIPQHDDRDGGAR